MNLGNTIIYVAASNDNGCDTIVSEVSILVNQQPENIIVNGDVSVCLGETINISLISNGSENFVWYENAALTVVSNDPSIQTNSTNNDAYVYSSSLPLDVSYWVIGETISGCNTEVYQIDIKALDVTSVQVDSIETDFCQGNLTFNAIGNNVDFYTWYLDSAGTNELNTVSGILNQELNIDANIVSGSFTIYLKGNNNNGCESGLIPFTYNVLTKPDFIEIIGLNNSYCINDDVNIITSFQEYDNIIFAYDINFTNLLNNNLINSTETGLMFTADAVENSTIYYKAVNNNGCESDINSFQLNIFGNPIAPNVINDNQIICQGEDFSVSVNSNDTIKWFNDIDLTDEITTNISGNTYSLEGVHTQNMNPGNYNIYITSLNTNGCQSLVSTVTYTIAQKPTTPTFTNNNSTYCESDIISIDFTSFGSNNFDVSLTSGFTTPVPNNKLKFNSSGSVIGIEFQTEAVDVGSHIYYIRAINDNCVSEAEILSFSILQGVQNFTVTSNFLNNEVCEGETIILTASSDSPGTTYKYYNNVGDLLNTTPIYSINTNILTSGNHFFTVEAENANNCTELYNVTINVLSQPQQIQISGNIEYCLNDTVSLLLSGIDVTEFEWYYGSNTDNPVESEFISGSQSELLTFNTVIVNTRTFYYRAINSNGCASQLQSITIETHSNPSDIIVNNGSSNIITACKGSQLIVPVESSSNTIFNWFTNSILTVPLDSSYTSGIGNNTLNINTSNLLEGTYTYYLYAENQFGCVSSVSSVTFTIFEKLDDISIVGETILCTDNLGEFELISTNAVTYYWYLDQFGNVPVDSNFTVFNNGANIQFNADTAGNFILFYNGVTNDGCESDIEFIQYTVNTAADNITYTIEDDILCANQDLLDIQAGGSGITQFEWFKNADATIALEDEFVFGVLNDRVELVPDTPGNYSLWVRGINSTNCSSQILQIDYVVLDQPQITNAFLNDSPTDSQFEFQSTIVLTWEAINQTAYRILKNGTQIFPNNGYEVSQNSTYTITTLATALDNGNYSVEIINQECSTSVNKSVFVFESGLYIYHTKPENETIETDAFDNQVTYIDLDQNENIGFYTLLDDTIYQHTWHFGDTHNNIGREVLHYYNEEGLYTVYVEILNTITNVVTTLSLDKIIRVNEFQGIAIIDDLQPPTNNTFNFYPNPVQQKLHLDLTLEATQTVLLRIYDINGIVRFAEQFEGLQGQNTYEWNNPLYSATGNGAVYIAVLKYGDTINTYKLIKN